MPTRVALAARPLTRAGARVQKVTGDMEHRGLIRAVQGFALLSFLALASCKKEEDAAASAGDAGTDLRQPAVDPNLAKAVAAASAEADTAPATSAEGERPPPKGVFAPGEADQKIKKDAPPKLVFGDGGEQPRITLATAPPAPSDKFPFDVEVSIRVGRNLTPNLRFGLVYERAKAAAHKPATAAEEQAPTSALPEPVDAMVRVASTSLDPAQAARIPESERDLIAGFKDSKMRFRVAPDGGIMGVGIELAKRADPGLRQPLEALGEVVDLLLLPRPTQPVGKDAYWMTTTRESIAGIDTVAYCMVRVREVQGGVAVLDLSAKRYAASSAVDLSGAPPELGELRIDGFQATASGTLRVQSGVPVPLSGQLSSEVSAMAVTPKAPGQVVPLLQAAVKAKLSSTPSGEVKGAGATPERAKGSAPSPAPPGAGASPAGAARGPVSSAP